MVVILSLYGSDSFAEGIDLDVVDPVAHKHIPKVVILVKMASEWAKSHGGKLPHTRQEKQEFKVKKFNKNSPCILCSKYLFAIE